MTTGTKAEKPVPLGARVYAKHRKIIRKWASKFKISDATVVRDALELYHKENTSLAEQ